MTYTPPTWVTGDPLLASQMNSIAQALDAVDANAVTSVTVGTGLTATKAAGSNILTLGLNGVVRTYISTGSTADRAAALAAAPAGHVVLIPVAT